MTRHCKVTMKSTQRHSLTKLLDSKDLIRVESIFSIKLTKKIMSIVRQKLLSYRKFTLLNVWILSLMALQKIFYMFKERF